MTLLDANVVSNVGPKVFGAVLLGVTVLWAVASTAYGKEIKNKLNIKNEKVNDSKVK